MKRSINSNKGMEQVIQQKEDMHTLHLKFRLQTLQSTQPQRRAIQSIRKEYAIPKWLKKNNFETFVKNIHNHARSYNQTKDSFKYGVNIVAYKVGNIDIRKDNFQKFINELAQNDDLSYLLIQEKSQDQVNIMFEIENIQIIEEEAVPISTQKNNFNNKKQFHQPPPPPRPSQRILKHILSELIVEEEVTDPEIPENDLVEGSEVDGQVAKLFTYPLDESLIHMLQGLLIIKRAQE